MRLSPRFLALLFATFAVACDSKSEAPAPRPVRVAPAPQASAGAPLAQPAAAVPPATFDSAAVAKSATPEAAPAAAPSAAPAAAADAAKKLAPALALALAKPQSAQAPGQVPSLDPDIPVQDGDRVLVDIKANVSQPLVDRVVELGGTVVGSPGADGGLRAMIPLAQLTTLASRADVEAIAPAALTVKREAKNP